MTDSFEGFKELASLPYCDLFLAPGFSDVKEKPGYHSPRREVPPELAGLARDLRKALLERLSAVQTPEFSVRIGGLLHRVTAMTTADEDTTFILRRAMSGVRPLDSIPVAPAVRTVALDRGLRGLILVVGAQGVGKSTTAASIFVERVRLHGGVGVAIEDPIETDGLEGLHGAGRIHHYSASRHSGGYAEQLIKTLRHGADAIYIGEIREASAAQLVIREAANGCTIISTAHAGSIPEALTRLSDFFPMSGQGRALLAHSLRLIIHQDLVANERGTMLKQTTLSLMGGDALAIKQKIQDGRFAHLEEEIDTQRKRSLLSWPARTSAN